MFESLPAHASARREQPEKLEESLIFLMSGGKTTSEMKGSQSRSDGAVQTMYRG